MSFFAFFFISGFGVEGVEVIISRLLMTAPYDVSMQTYGGFYDLCCIEVGMVRILWGSGLWFGTFMSKNTENFILWFFFRILHEISQLNVE